ncbi:conserved hypothetical protein [Formosa agariphila KMM 3901]|uniref:Uncharacterized protein n=1 Tax=Formosa agariphila (strain DSM 15362 / KCTC 12365 / LMG 23005 / KMM 3901 / M-2Alg 35-1) TaxID=1347342 RepID=T2KL90_FORAG|nr:hypothetical protein [Formosa agariphila]CDF79505.1 conserved hypothetical protein [Formosa agariphila KMM 3901]
MKNIHFDNMRNKFWIAILILSIICFMIGIFEPIAYSNKDLNTYFLKSGFLLQVLYYSKMFWYKNYVQWNKKGVNIKGNSFFGKSLTFNQIIKTELNDKNLIITKTNGTKVTLDLNEIAEPDTQKLNEIIVKKTIANTI